MAGEVTIAWFEVAPEEDGDFLAAWAAEGGAGALYRAIRADAAYRFVAVSDGGEYELVREDGTIDVDGGVVLIATHDAPPELPTGRRGYIGSRLYRGADGFVEIARWSSPLMVFRAQRPGDLYLVVTATPSRSAS